MMRVEDIIAAETEKTGDDANQMIQTVSDLVNSQEGILLRKNDSVMLIIRIGGNDVEMNLFTADSPEVLPQSLKYFIDTIKGSDIRAIYSDSTDMELIDALTGLGFKPQKSDRPDYEWMV